MIDDLTSNTAKTDNSVKIEIVKYADSIERFRTDRRSSQRWARNLRFLTFEEPQNDIEEELVRGSYGVKKQCQRCEQDLKPEPGHICAAHRLNADEKYLKARERGIARNLDTCIHVQEAACQDCQHLPLFPNTGRPNTFRIRRLRPKDAKLSEFSSCNHFVAVSYCWSDYVHPPSGVPSTSGDPYTVLEEDGITVRTTRAPNSVLDRAVDFCRQNGVRMIWIDQECIRQDDDVEKSVAVQAMDMVYSTAFFSVALFRTGFKDQRDLDALCTLGSNAPRSDEFLLRPGRCKPPLSKSVNEQVFVDMLYRLSKETWLTRTWTFQEAFASGGAMIILIPKPEIQTISTSGRNILCNDLSTTEVAIKLDSLDQLLKMGISYFDKALRKDACNTDQLDCSTCGPGRFSRRALMRYRRVSALIKKADKLKLPDEWSDSLALLGRLYPDVLPTFNRPRISYGVRVDFRPCNAAIAMSFLVDRHNTVPADRLAIIANLCDYHIRLDVKEIGKSDLPLSSCVFVLAIMNGDFSLLCPESYNEKTRDKLLDTIPNLQNSFSWMRIDLEDLRHLSKDAMSSDIGDCGRDESTIYSLTGKGLSTSGCLWKINSFINLRQIQRSYRPGWKKLQARRRKRDVTSANDIEEQYRLATTHILFEILTALKSAGEVEAADAVWQSTFDRRWQFKLGLNAAETVAEWPERLQVYNRAGMFRIDTDTNGDYNCSWLIERVIRDGGIWVGNLIDASFETAMRGSKNEPSDHSKQSQLQELSQSLREHSQNFSITPPTKESYINTVLSICFPDDAIPSENRTQSDSQQRMSHLMWQYFEANLRTVLDSYTIYLDGVDLDTASSPSYEGILGFCWAAFLNSMTNSTEYFSRQRAIFDLDGNTDGNVLVLTPYRRTLEMIPTPAARAMSNSWVVEPVSLSTERNEKAGAEAGEKNFRTLKTGRMVRGMWHLQDIPGTRYHLV